MWLAIVRRDFPDELICDLAETYGVLEYEALDVRLVASLLWGLRADSRVNIRVMASRKKKETNVEKDVQAFDTAEEFEAARRRIMETEG